MPFEGKQIETPALRRALLIDALRNNLPAGFEWRFHTIHRKTPCGTSGCAIGVMLEMGMVRNTKDLFDDVFEALGVTSQQGNSIFCTAYAQATYGVPVSMVTPAMVADALERLS